MNKGQDKTVSILEIEHECITVFALGQSPLICNRMSEKAKRQLLMPSGRMTAADKAVNLKHSPLDEYRASPYTSQRTDAATRLQALGAWFKGAMRTAALDMPGAKKAQIGRQLWVRPERIDLYGVPQLLMAITRSADIGKTPDVRTRAIVPRWACTFEIQFPVPLLRAQSIINLLAASGIMSGVGDWRAEKGSGNYGAFRLCAADDPEYLEIVRTGGAAAQDAALASPQCYDDESESLLAWFDEQVHRRGESQGRKVHIEPEGHLRDRIEKRVKARASRKDNGTTPHGELNP